MNLSTRRRGQQHGVDLTSASPVQSTRRWFVELPLTSSSEFRAILQSTTASRAGLWMTRRPLMTAAVPPHYEHIHLILHQQDGAARNIIVAMSCGRPSSPTTSTSWMKRSSTRAKCVEWLTCVINYTISYLFLLADHRIIYFTNHTSCNLFILDSLHLNSSPLQ